MKTFKNILISICIFIAIGVIFSTIIYWTICTVKVNYTLPFNISDESKLFYFESRETNNYLTYFDLIGCKAQFEVLEITTKNIIIFAIIGLFVGIIYTISNKKKMVNKVM